MATKVTKKRKRRSAVRRPEYKRRTYMLDQETIRDSGIIQQGLRASTASEAVRYALRQMAVLMRYVNEGYVIQAMPPATNKGAIPLLVDIPSAKGVQ
jgi:hypothetical protein